MGETPAWWQVTGLSGSVDGILDWGQARRGSGLKAVWIPLSLRQDSLPCYCWQAGRGTLHLTLHDRCSLLSETDFTCKDVRSR